MGGSPGVPVQEAPRALPQVLFKYWDTFRTQPRNVSKLEYVRVGY